MQILNENVYNLKNGKGSKIITLGTTDKVNRMTCVVLANEKDEIITPAVTSITFDEENQVFFVRDRLVIDEYLTGSISYYVDYQGIPLGMCFSDIMDGFYKMDFDNAKDYKKGYEDFKSNLSQQIKQEVNRKSHVDLDNCKKLALYKKGVIESEN